MRTPKQIQYHGQIYVRAAHKKCPTGQHWNEQTSQCQPLPAEVAHASTAAHQATAAASAAPKPRLLDPETTARRLSAVKQQAHATAGELHQRARDLAQQHGFTELGHQHDAARRHHEARTRAYTWL